MAQDITRSEDSETEDAGTGTADLAAVLEHDRALLAGIAIRRRWALIMLVTTLLTFVLAAGYVVSEWARTYGPDGAIVPSALLGVAGGLAVFGGWTYGLLWTQGRLMPLVVRQFKAFLDLESVARTDLDAANKEHIDISNDVKAMNVTYARVLEELKRAREEGALIDRSIFGTFEPKRSGRRPYLANEWARGEVSQGVSKAALRQEWQARLWAEMQKRGITQQPADWDDTFRKVFPPSSVRKK